MRRLRYFGIQVVVVNVTSRRREAIGWVAYVSNVATGWSMRLVYQYRYIIHLRRCTRRTTGERLRWRQDIEQVPATTNNPVSWVPTRLHLLQVLLYVDSPKRVLWQLQQLRLLLSDRSHRVVSLPRVLLRRLLRTRSRCISVESVQFEERGGRGDIRDRCSESLDMEPGSMVYPLEGQ
jgi:hypothetical protein